MLKMKKWLLLILMGIMMIEIVNAEGSITRGANWDNEQIDHNKFKKTYYMGAVNIQDESGDFVPFEDYVDVSINNGLVFQRNNRWGVTFRPFFVMQDNSIYRWSDIPTSIEKKPWKQEYRGKIKYGFDFNYVPDNIKNNLKYVILERVDSFGLTWDDVSIENSSILVWDSGINKTIVFSHNDILQHYTIPLINKSMVVIGNLTENFKLNDDGTWNISFDPTVSYNFSDEINIWAWDCDDSSDAPPPASKLPSCTATVTEQTSNTNLDSSNDIYVQHGDDVSDTHMWIYFNASIQESSINRIIWFWEGKTNAPFGVTYYLYAYNFTSSSYEQYGSSTSTTDVVLKVNTTDITDFVDSNGQSAIIAHINDPWTSGDAGYLYTDFAKLEVTHTIGDTTPPIINGTLNKTINIEKNNVINASFNLTDETGLRNGTITINQTGAIEYFNFSFGSPNPPTQEMSQKFTITCSGCTINITGIARDNSSNEAQNETIINVNSIYNLTITDPTTANPRSVNLNETINMTFNFTKDNIEVTSGISIINASIGTYNATINVTPIAASCSGTPSDCNTYGTQEGCENATCDWTASSCANNGNCASSATCAECPGCSAGAGSCSGGAVTCGDGGSGCCAEAGCTWFISICLGSGDCSNLDDQTCCEDFTACTWTPGCTGTLNCPTYDSDQTNCQECDQCTWNAATCSGTPAACNTYTNNSACTAAGCDWTAASDAQQFGFNLNDNLWHLNISNISTTLTGTQDLQIFVNYMTDSIVRNDTQIDAIDYGVVDSCLPTCPLSADYIFQCSDYCNNVVCDANQKNVLITGTGGFQGTITNFKSIRTEGTDANNKCYARINT